MKNDVIKRIFESVNWFYLAGEEETITTEIDAFQEEVDRGRISSLEDLASSLEDEISEIGQGMVEEVTGGKEG